MNTISSAFENIIRRLVEREKQNLVGIICNSVAVETFEKYHNLTGQLAALNMMDGLFDEAAEIVNKS